MADPADIAESVAVRLRGGRWPTVCRGLIEVVTVEVVRGHWPIQWHLTVENDDWDEPRRFDLSLPEERMLRGVRPEACAEAMAEDVLMLLESSLMTQEPDDVV